MIAGKTCLARGSGSCAAIVASFLQKRGWVLVALSIVILALAFLSLSQGEYEAVRAPQVVAVLAHKFGLSQSAVDPTVENVVMALRLPRVVLAILAGAAIAMAGAALQGLFRNPLADPALVGVSSGAALGAVIVIVIGGTVLHGFTIAFNAFALPVAAMAGGVGVTFLIYHLAKVAGRTHLTLMLLTGLALNALAGAAIGLLVYVATNEQLRELMFWSLGSLNRAGWFQIAAAAAFAVPHTRACSLDLDRFANPEPR